jgi:hypothetical protein
MEQGSGYPEARPGGKRPSNPPFGGGSILGMKEIRGKTATRCPKMDKVSFSLPELILFSGQDAKGVKKKEFA